MALNHSIEAPYNKIPLIRWQLKFEQLYRVLTGYFGSIDRDYLQEIEHQFEWRYLKRGEVLYNTGDKGDALYGIINGRLEIVADNNDDKKSGRYIAGDGETVGEAALLTGGLRNSTVQAARDSLLVKISKDNLTELMKRHPLIMKKISEKLIKRLRLSSQRPIRDTSRGNIMVLPLDETIDTSGFTKMILKAINIYAPALHFNSEKSIYSLHGEKQFVDDEILHLHLADRLGKHEKEYRYIIYEADAIMNQWTELCFQKADVIVLLANPHNEHHISALEEKLSLYQGVNNKIPKRLVLVHPDGKIKPEETLKWLENRDVDMHHHLRFDNINDFNRLARFMTGNAVGLVLGGGGARGLTHIGVIKALQETGVEIDIIGSASMGAAVGALMANEEDYKSIYNGHRDSFIVNRTLRRYTLPLVSMLNDRLLNRCMKKAGKNLNIEDLWINFFCVATDLTNSELKIYREGKVWKRARSSGSVPGLIPPMIDNGALMVDGGLLNNLPVDIMKKYTNGPVIAVDVSDDMAIDFTHENYPGPWKIILSRLLPFVKKIKFPSVATIIMKSTVVYSIKKNRETNKLADYYLRPPVDDIGMLDVDAIDRLVDIGYRYTLDQIESWSIAGLKKKI